MDLEFYVRIRTCEKRVTGKQPLQKINCQNFLSASLMQVDLTTLFATGLIFTDLLRLDKVNRLAAIC